MNSLFPFLSGLFLFFASANPETLRYPVTHKVDSTDVYFGTRIQDPYRWLENDRSSETMQWVKEQNALTADYFSQIPSRDKIKNRLNELWNFEKRTAPFKKGDYYFIFKNDGMQNQSVLYYQRGVGGEMKQLLDPNLFSKDGTSSLHSLEISDDARYLAYSVSHAGSDWSEIHVKEVESGNELTDRLKWIKFSGISWYKNGFFYSRYNAPQDGKEFLNKNEYHKVYYHRLGDEQSRDSIVYEDKQRPQLTFAAQVTHDKTHLIISSSNSASTNALLVKNLSGNGNFIQLMGETAESNVVDFYQGKMIVLTSYKAPKYRLLAIDPLHPEEENWKEIIPETNDLLDGVVRCGNKLVAKYLKDVTSRIYVYTMEGKKENEINLPGIGKVEEINGDSNDSLLFFSYVTFITPSSVWKYNLNDRKSTVYFRPTIAFKSEEYETRQVFFTSKDGTKIPMFITSKKGLKLDGTHPAFLFGYGGFNVSYTPEFRIDRTVFLEKGGIYAVANIRGGGEYGETWHLAGTKCNKQNVFDDFIAAAEYLVNEKYTNHNKLAIHGRSNGGLLVGAVMTQRPDLAKVALPTVGVMDMLRYHTFTIGWAWAGDYGTSQNKEEFECLLRYSPLHNIKNTSYPATLITTADHDDRVVPAHSFKYAATLQANQLGSNPVLIRIDANAGHGSGKPTDKQIAEFADIWSFVFYNLGITY